jgi:Flp pilus assembly protein TadD
MGLVYSKLHHHREAIAAFEKAVTLEDALSMILYKMARQQVMIGDFTAAVKNYRQAIEIEPRNQRAKNDLQKMLQFLRNCRTLEVCLEKLCTEYPQNPDLRFALGNLYEEKGNIQKAVTYYNKVLSMIPESNRQIYLLTVGHIATCYLLSGDLDKAKSFFLKGARLWPTNNQFYYQIAAINFGNGNIDEGFRWFEKAIDNGFKDSSQLEADTRLETVQNEARFQKMKARVIAASNN